MENNKIRKNREKQGNLPAIKNERDGLIIDMKVRGHKNREIAEATGIKLKTVQNIVTKGGRLYPAIQSLRTDKVVVLQEGNLSAWESLLASKDPAVNELRRLALESGNEVVRLKAIDMILELTGVRDADKPPLLDPANMIDSLECLGKWLNKRLIMVYQEKAPKIVFEYATNEPKVEINMSQEGLSELEKIIEKIDNLNDKLLESRERRQKSLEI